MDFFELSGYAGVLPVDDAVQSFPFDEGQSLGSANDPPNGPPGSGK